MSEDSAPLRPRMGPGGCEEGVSRPGQGAGTAGAEEGSQDGHGCPIQWKWCQESGLRDVKLLRSRRWKSHFYFRPDAFLPLTSPEASVPSQESFQIHS